MAMSGEYGGGEHGHIDGWPPLLDMPSTVVLGIGKMQMQLATADIPQLLSMPVSQWKNHVIDEVCRYEGYVPW
jgi:hypothetical protein